MAEVTVIECFGEPNEHLLRRLGHAAPTVWNDKVAIKRYRITVEEIVEPDTVLKDRMEALLKTRGHIDKNRHIRDEAKRLGIKLDSNP